MITTTTGMYKFYFLDLLCFPLSDQNDIFHATRFTVDDDGDRDTIDDDIQLIFPLSLLSVTGRTDGQPHRLIAMLRRI